MTIYEGTAEYLLPDGQYITVDATDIEDAEYKMKEIVLEDCPDAVQIEINNIKEVKKR